MAYKYKHFIPQNTAPSGAKSIGVYDSNGNKICSVALGGLTPPTKEKLYSFGLLSDMHVADYDPLASEKLDSALSFFKKQDVSFLCHCGDMTNTGFWYPISETEHTGYFTTSQFDEFYRICNKYNMVAYGNCGNHESYNEYDIARTYTDIYGTDPTLVVNNLEKLQEYTGNGLVFTMTHQNDVFIFVGQSTQGLPMTVEHLQWLQGKLEENKDKRCFVFVHSYISQNDSGNPLGFHSLPLFDFWGDENTNTFINTMSQYKNAILFHGHSHIHFSTQEQVSHAIYSKNLGFHSVHVPSSANGRKLIKDTSGNYTLGKKDTQYSLGYLVDVYNDCIVLNGMDLINNIPVPLGVYKIKI